MKIETNCIRKDFGRRWIGLALVWLATGNHDCEVFGVFNFVQLYRYWDEKSWQPTISNYSGEIWTLRHIKPSELTLEHDAN